MERDAPTVSLKVWGEHALFTHPAFPVERITHPVLTPSAARGILEAILYRPQMRWLIRRITVLVPQFPASMPDEARREPYRYMDMRRNEVQNGLAANTIAGWVKKPETCKPCSVETIRTQRNSKILTYVAYQIDATLRLTARANKPRIRPETTDDCGPDTVTKYVAMFNRRVAKGQCYIHPYLGCSEFSCHFAPPSDEDKVITTLNLNMGWLMYDKYTLEGQYRPGFFDAKITNGVLHCDMERAGPNGEPPITVIGWDTQTPKGEKV